MTEGSDGSWIIEHRTGRASDFLMAETSEMKTRTIRVLDVSEPALILGSTQPDALADRVATDGQGIDVVRRRSGGGAVLLGSDDCVWVDVFIPRGDRLWDDDVNRSFHWLGEAWVRVLADLDLVAEVHRDRLDRTTWSRFVCFAGMGPGEVTVEGAKAVGLSQRRIRAGALFQCVAYFDGVSTVSRIVDLLTEPSDPGKRSALRAHLNQSTYVLPVERRDVIEAISATFPIR